MIKLKDIIFEDLTRVCSWCKKENGTVPATETGITHGICDDCREKISKEMGLNLPPKS